MTSDNWIPVSRETPKEADWYVVTRIHGRTGRRFVDKAFYSVNDQEFNELNVIAWQPMPEPYEEDGWVLVSKTVIPL